MASDWQKFFELSVDMCCIATSDGYFKEVSPAWTETLGWTAEELKSRPILEFVHPDDMLATLEIIKTRQQVTPTSSFENRYRARTGEFHWLSWRAYFDEGTQLFYAMARDVSPQRKQTELIDELQSTARVGAYEFTILDSKATWTREIHRIFEMLPKPDMDAETLLDFFDPPQRRMLGRAFANCAQGTEFELELECVTALGRRRWIRIIGRPAYGSSGVRKVYGTIQDVTSSKRSELRERHLISIVSHELRTPLTSIRGALSLLKRSVADVISTRDVGMLEIADRNAERLEKLVDDMLDLERIESDVFNINKSRINFSQLVRDTILIFELPASQNNIKLVLGNCPDDVFVEADQDRVGQVLANLMSNALRFSPRDTDIMVNIECQSDAVYFDIVDRGSGIPDEYHRTIFDRFTQAPNHLAAGGSGLGLYISKMIVSRHGGEIGIKSEPGGGSRFYFTIPLSK